MPLLQTRPMDLNPENGSHLTVFANASDGGALYVMDCLGQLSKLSSLIAANQTLDGVLAQGGQLQTSYIADMNANTIQFKMGVIQMTDQFANPRMSLAPITADGGTAVAYFFDTRDVYANAAAKLLSVRNSGAEKFFIDKDGAIYPGNAVTASVANTVTNKIKLRIGATDYFLLASTSNA